jgi:hypothetical protein
MAHSKHPLFPETIAEQIADLDSKRKYLKANQTRFGISSTDMEKIDTLVDAAIAANTVASNRDTRTKLDVATRILDIETAQGIERKVIDYYVIGNPNTTEVDYEALRIPRPGPHPHLPDPKDIPGIRRLTSSNLAVLISFFNIQTGKRSKPAGVQAIEAYYKIGGDPPANISEMSERLIGTASPLRIQFEFGQELQVVYLVFRWVGTRGSYGPWSEIYRIAIAR